MTVQGDEPREALFERARGVFTPNYRQQPVVFVEGEGVHLVDRTGRRYLDFTAGIAVCCLGHGHPELAAAIGAQARALLHVSNLYFNQPSIDLAQCLVDRSFADRVYLCNSGTEANEAALKMARRYMRLVRGEDRYEFICAQGSFHGRTWAAISATGQPKYHAGFEPLVPGFVHVPYDDLAAVESAITEATCAVFVEPIQGEGGVRVPTPAYLPGLRKLCDERGILLILDEVQTGVGRTGTWWGHEPSGITPDIMTLAKGLGGGVPVGATLATEEAARGFAPGAHASTFGGNPLASQAALAVMTILEREGLVAHAAEVGAHLKAGLTELTGRHEWLVAQRGRGLLQGLAVDPERVDRAAVLHSARERGLLVTMAGPDAIRLSPPLIVEPAHVDQALDLLEQALLEVVG